MFYKLCFLNAVNSIAPYHSTKAIGKYKNHHMWAHLCIFIGKGKIPE